MKVRMSIGQDWFHFEVEDAGGSRTHSGRQVLPLIEGMSPEDRRRFREAAKGLIGVIDAVEAPTPGTIITDGPRTTPGLGEILTRRFKW